MVNTAEDDSFTTDCGSRRSSPPANDFTNESLTTREYAVLAELARGRCNKAIARDLDIAIGTVKAQVRSILAKINATSRTEAAMTSRSRAVSVA